DDEVYRQVVGAAQKLPPENQEVRKLKAWGLEAPVLEGRILQPGVQRSGTWGICTPLFLSAGSTIHDRVSYLRHSICVCFRNLGFRFAAPQAEVYVLPGLGPPAPQAFSLRTT
ncbi:hypothetical protein LJC72_07955, partial [Bacteroides sp. OttesenSCG-928-D19]|nr:hypothetical protein [Bacteroides sp. OttesenSCG-928-D19]